MKKLIYVCLFICSSAFAGDNLLFSLQGKLVEKGSKTPIPFATIIVKDEFNTTLETDANGSFKMNSSSAIMQADVSATGYRPATFKFTCTANAPCRHTIFLQPLEFSNTFQTMVRSKKKKVDQNQKTLTDEDFLSVPGAGRDPIKAVSNLAGINRAPAFASNVIIQGAGLFDTQYFIDGHEVPIVFHFGGLSTVVFPEATESVDYFSAGYSPKFSRALGGVIGLNLRSPRNDRFRALGFMDVYNVGGLIEGGMGHHSYLFSLRQSYIGAVLKAVLKSETLSFNVAPRYSDLTGVYEYSPSSKKQFRITSIASIDALSLITKDPFANDPFLRGNFKNKTQFLRLIPQYNQTIDNHTNVSTSLGVGVDQFKFNLDNGLLDIRSATITPRLEWNQTYADQSNLILGMDHRIHRTRAIVSLPNDYAPGGLFNPLSSSTVVKTDVTTTEFDGGLYARYTEMFWNQRVGLTPGLRMDYFQSTNDVFFDPRYAAWILLSHQLKLKTQGGLYHQPPQPRETTKVGGNPDLATPRAWHMTAGFEKQFTLPNDQGLVLEAGYFSRWFDDIVTRSNQLIDKGFGLVPEFYNSSTTGRSQGGELTLKFQTSRMQTQLAYTLLKSQLNEVGYGKYRSPYDQTHNVNFIAGVDLKKRWRLGARIRYVSGNPYTPVTSSSFDADQGVYVPQRGRYYSARASDFFQIDIRIDKEWLLKTWKLALYLDMQNISNRANQESVEFSYDFQRLIPSNGLPFIPSFGLRGEY